MFSSIYVIGRVFRAAGNLSDYLSAMGPKDPAVRLRRRSTSTRKPQTKPRAGHRSDGGTATSFNADVTDYDSVVRAFDAAVSEFGGVDIVVINAGGNLDRSSDVESGSTEQWIGTVQLNIVGAYHTARAAIPHLKQRGGGKIIAIGSGLGRRGGPGMSAYASSKAGLSMLIRVLALELWQHNISVNELVPGPVLTDLVAQSYAQNPGSVFQDDSEWVKMPKDVVPLALFLATQPDKGPTGQTYSLVRRDM